MICQSADGGLELFDLVGALPRELDVDAAEVTVCGGLRVNRALEVKLVDDRGGTQVEHLAHGLLDLLAGHADFGAERLDVDRHRFSHANRVGDLQLDTVRQPRGDDVLRHPAGRVRGGTVDLGRVLAAERAAAMVGGAAVRVDDDLAAGQAGVGGRTSEDERAGRVDELTVIVMLDAVAEHLVQHRVDDMLLSWAASHS